MVNGEIRHSYLQRYAMEPSGLATRPEKVILPSSPLDAYPAMGVRHDPSSAVRKARSVPTAMRVSSWFSPAR